MNENKDKDKDIDLDNDQFINIIIQSYNEENSGRLVELETAILGNLNNIYVNKVFDIRNISEKSSFSSQIINHPKYEVVHYEKWLTFEKAFEFGSNAVYHNKYFAILNSDIMLDTSCNWSSIKVYLDNNVIMALSRHEFNNETGDIKMDENLGNILHCHTQDGWFFKSPLNEIKDCNFEIGLLGCDNAIAHRLINSGYKVINKPIQYKLIHIDSVRGKNSSNFLQYHNNNKKITNQHPEKKGYYLLPNCDLLSNTSIDNLIEQFNYSPLEKYKLICDIFTNCIQINNTPS